MMIKKNVKLKTMKKGHIMKMIYAMMKILIDIQKYVNHRYLKIKEFITLQFYNEKRMKARIITSILAIMLLANLQFIFLSSIQTTFHQTNSNCDSSYPDTCISSPTPNLNCEDVSDKDFEVLSPDLMDLTVMKMV